MAGKKDSVSISKEALTVDAASLVKTPDGPFCTVLQNGGDKPVFMKHRAFCVSMLGSGSVVRCEGDSTGEFMDIIKDSKMTWVNFTLGDVEKEGMEIAEALGFNTKILSELLASYSNNYEDFETELGLKLPAVTVKGMDVHTTPLIILIKKGLILSLAGGEVVRLVRFSRYAHTFMKKINYKDWRDILTSFLVRIIDENNDRNFDYLREIQAEGDFLSKKLMDPLTPRQKLGEEIYMMKHALITYLNSLWMSLDVINSLRYGDAEVITDDEHLLAKITVLANDITNQISLSEHMSEVLASGLEVLQSIYNNQLQILNNKLAFVATWLAILGTAIIVPNTIATIFGVPPIADRWGWEAITIVLASSTVLSGAFMYWLVKKKGWIPEATLEKQ